MLVNIDTLAGLKFVILGPNFHVDQRSETSQFSDKEVNRHSYITWFYPTSVSRRCLYVRMCPASSASCVWLSGNMG